MDVLKPACVITTINYPTKTVADMVDRFPNVIVIGDKKTPRNWSYPGATIYYDNPEGVHWPAPDNHYARKNLGYLLAIRQRANLIYDIDDDNYPTSKWKMRDKPCQATWVKCQPGSPISWCNVYQRLTGGVIWPRGFSLEHLDQVGVIGEAGVVDSPIQQGLANGDTDVDAIWRLALSREVTFDSGVSLALKTNLWCPFNSQTTWWWPEAYHLLYLPVYSTFRMCDIWRSFVAQRCLWSMGKSVVFHSPAEVFQDRNPHNLLADFKDEIPGYLNNARVAKVLSDLVLTGTDKSLDVYLCYEALVKDGLLPPDELKSLLSWQINANAILI